MPARNLSRLYTLLQLSPASSPHTSTGALPRKSAPSTPTTYYLTLQLLYTSQVSRLKMSSPKKTGIQVCLALFNAQQKHH